MATINLGDHGLDQGDVIDGYLSSYWTAGNTVYIPEGSYQWRGNFGGSSKNNSALIGNGDVVFRLQSGYDIDNDLIVGSGTMTLKNITVRNRCTRGRGEKNRIRVNATGSSGKIYINNFNLPDGSVGYGTYPSTIGIYVGSSHDGYLELYNCEIANFPNNGLYADHCPGRIRTECCWFHDNDIDNVRLSPSDQLINTLIHTRYDRTDQPEPIRAVRKRYSGNCLIDGLHVHCPRGEPLTHVASGTTTIRNTYIRNNTGSDVFRVKAGTISIDSNVNITGTGSYATVGSIQNEGRICKGSGCATPLTDIADICAGAGGGSDDGTTPPPPPPPPPDVPTGTYKHYQPTGDDAYQVDPTDDEYEMYYTSS